VVERHPVRDRAQPGGSPGIDQAERPYGAFGERREERDDRGEPPRVVGLHRGGREGRDQRGAGLQAERAERTRVRRVRAQPPRDREEQFRLPLLLGDLGEERDEGVVERPCPGGVRR